MGNDFIGNYLIYQIIKRDTIADVPVLYPSFYLSSITVGLITDQSTTMTRYLEFAQKAL